MRTTISNGEIKRQNMIKMIQYILEHDGVSRQEIAASLGYSFPTVFQNVTELLEWGLLYEAGTYGSTGGRKAKILRVKEGFRCTVGVEITRNHIRMVLMDFNGRLIDKEQQRFAYEDTSSYYFEFGKRIQEFVRKNGIGPDNPFRLVGIGISIPGIIDHSLGILRQSHTLNIKNISLKCFAQNIPWDFCCENDANNAAYAEVSNKQKNTVYLSLNDTLGGAVYLGGNIYKGDNFKSAEFGHVIIEPKGRKCYCGKKGCLDAYCSARVLNHSNTQPLEKFFEDLSVGIQQNCEEWEEYLEYLAIAVSNIRMEYDCDIILGGHVGGYMEQYLHFLENKVRELNRFDYDMSYVSVGKYKRESSAIGAAKHMMDHYISNLEHLA